jgi:hypothetical protein
MRIWRCSKLSGGCGADCRPMLDAPRSRFQLGSVRGGLLALLAMWRPHAASTVHLLLSQTRDAVAFILMRCAFARMLDRLLGNLPSCTTPRAVLVRLTALPLMGNDAGQCREA